MSSGCIPKRADRINALGRVVKQLRAATEILASIDPDREPERLADAGKHIDDALGQRAGGEFDASKALGLEDLIEHYFS